MAWFALARVLLVAAVGYSAFQLEPLGPQSALLNIAFGIVLGLLGRPVLHRSQQPLTRSWIDGFGAPDGLGLTH